MKTAKELQLFGEIKKSKNTFIQFYQEWRHYAWIEKNLKNAAVRGYHAIIFKTIDISDIELYRLYHLGYNVEETKNKDIKISW